MRLIDADALMNELMKVRWAYQTLDNTQRADIAMGGLRNAEKKVEEAPTIDAVPRWIPCEERLPEKEEKAYLVYLDNGHVCDCKWWCRNLVSLEPTEQWRWDIFDIPQYSRVLAWMPLPDPYEGERKDNE